MFLNISMKNNDKQVLNFLEKFLVVLIVVLVISIQNLFCK